MIRSRPDPSFCEGWCPWNSSYEHNKDNSKRLRIDGDTCEYFLIFSNRLLYGMIIRKKQ